MLGARHPTGAASYDVSDLSGSIFSPDLDQVEEVVADSWLRDKPPEFADPRTIVHIHVLVDCVFALAYAALLALLAWRLLGALQAASTVANMNAVAAHRLRERDVAVTDESIEDEVVDLQPVVARYVALARLAFKAAFAVLAVDVLENVIQWVAVDHYEEHWLYVPLYAATVAKWLLVTFVLVALVLGLLGLDMLHPRAKNRLAATVVVARAPLILAALLALAFLTDLTPFGEQASDVLLSWNENRADAVVGVILFAWLSLLTLVLARRLVAPTPETARAARMSAQAELILGRPAPIDLRRALPLHRLRLVGAGLIGVWLVLRHEGIEAKGALVVGGILLAVAILSAFGSELPSTPLPVVTAGRLSLPALAAAAPLVVLGLALVAATVPEITWAKRGEEYLAWYLIGIGLVVAGLGVFGLARRPLAAWVVARGRLVIWPTAALLAYLIWRVWMHPWRVADALGAFGVFAAAAGAGLLVAYLLMWPEERLRPPSIFRVLRLRRIPVFGLLVVWAVVAALLDQGGFHDVRVRTASPPLVPAGDRQGLSVGDVFRQWRDRNAPSAQAAAGRTVQPLVLVVAAGGGVRAAYWTGIVLECVFGGRGAEACASPIAREAERAVFAASSASGGSVGLASWIAHLRSHRADWLEHLGDDSVTPTLAWSFFVDLPNAFLKLDAFGDRAQVLERTWEQQWGGRDTSIASLLLPLRRGPPSRGPLAEGLFAAAGDSSLPLLLLTSTSAEDGCRFVVSALDSNVGGQRVGTRIDDCITMRSFEGESDSYVRPENRIAWSVAASKDLDDYLCPSGDIRLSTAALLSARFPYVSPSGRLVKCGDESEKTATYLVDGGYFDNTGASSLVELWAALEPLVARHNATQPTCIAPFVLEIDNHYGDPPGPEPEPRPNESQVPLQTLLGTRNAQEASARQAMALVGSTPFADDLVVKRGAETVERFARVYPRAHPGTRAPLGWALSEAARSDLRVELGSDRNANAIETARSWFRQGLTCEIAQR